MHRLTEWFVRNPVAANLLMALIVLAGGMSLSVLRIESFPRIPPRRINITVVNPGASAAQVDEGVTQKIEQALEGMPGVRRVFSSSQENLALVTVEKTSGTDLQRLLEDARMRVDGIVGWPESAERPSITRDESSVFGLIVQVTGDVDEGTLQRAARMVEDELLDHSQISDLELFGKRTPEVSLEVDDGRLEAYGLSFAEVRDAVVANSFDYRAGVVNSDGQRILLRADHRAMQMEDFAEIPVVTTADGVLLRLRDLGRVRDGFEEQIVRARFNGQPSVGIIVNTDAKGHLLRVRSAVDEVLQKVEPRLPAAVRVEVWADASEYIQERLHLLRTNAWQGLLIIVGLLTLFLDLKLAFWVAMGVPISVAGTVALMGERFLGQSLNDMTTFGMIIVLGFLVDDAIVVGESVHDARRRIGDPVEGAIAGVDRVATATVFGAMTTIAAFFPLLLIDNDIARIFAGFSVVVVVAVLVSLVESKLILPAHLAGISPRSETTRRQWLRGWMVVRERVDQALTWVIQRVYRPALVVVLHHRYAALTALVAVAAAGIGAMVTGRIPTVFFPEVPGNTITVTVTMDRSSPEALARVNADRIESAVGTANRELQGRYGLAAAPIAKVMAVVVGRQRVEAYGELTREAMDRIGTTAVLNRWREAVGELEGAQNLRFTGSFETGGGFALEVIGSDEAAVAEVVAALTQALGGHVGVHDVRSDLYGGQPEIRFRLGLHARSLGLTVADLATQLGDGFGGLEVQRMQRNTDEVRVLVRYLEEHRRTLHEVLNARIVTPQGHRVPLLAVAEIESGYGPGSINRRDGQRAVTVEATLDRRMTGASRVFDDIGDLLATIPQRWPGVEVRPAGELEEMGEIQDGMSRALLFIAALIYALLAVPLRSYSKPLVIMSVVPFAFAGAALGHLLMGLPLSILSFFGMLAATGVVVNDSLVLVSRSNQLCDEGDDAHEALVEAGCSRFRAIFLTTATTVSGLLPLLLETSEQAQYLIPAAVSLAFAELVATPVTLFVVPLTLQVLEDVRVSVMTLRRRWCAAT